MDLNQLAKAAADALAELDALISKQGANDALTSIQTQVDFIRKHADNGENPKAHLKGNKFTYAIIASRELASPDEMIVQEKLDKITILLKALPKS